MYNSTLPSTSALEGGLGGQHHAPAALPTGKDPVSIVQDTGWAPGPVWSVRKNLTPTGIRSPDRPAHSAVAIPTELSRPPNTFTLFLLIYFFSKSFSKDNSCFSARKANSKTRTSLQYVATDICNAARASQSPGGGEARRSLFGAGKQYRRARRKTD